MGELPKLDALLESAGKATARPWKLIVWSGAVSLEHDGESLSGIMDPEDGSYVADAVNAAEDMARLLMEAHDYLLDPYCLCTSPSLYGHDDDCDHNADKIAAKIEARFGGEEGENSG